MHQRILLWSLVFVAALAPAGVSAAPVNIAAGETYSLSSDVVLSGADTLDAAGTVSSPCVIVGNGHAIIANDLTGHVKVQNCIFRGLGGAMETEPALDLTMQDADVTITGSTFDASGSIRLHLYGSATATFSDNLLADTGIAYIQDELLGSVYVPAFYADGSSTGTKVFQGNRIYRSAAHFEGVDNWLIGGYGDEFTNVIVGHRGVIRVSGNHVKVAGNFINPQYPLTSPDVENLVVGSNEANPDLVVEHNVLRSGEWVLRECQGEVRYNLIADMNGHAWIKGPHDCNVHHNIFVNYDNPDHNSEGGIDVVYFTPHLNVYNNTFDGGGTIGNLGVPAIHAKQGLLIERVHSNAITNFVIQSAYAAISKLGPDTYEDNPPPGDTRMHYADYNLFYNPDSPSQIDYSIPVEPDDVTPLVQGSDGFAKHDVHAPPGFTGPLPTAFPFATADVQAGTAKVSEILAHYRDLYTPASGSPLTGAGDPMGGAGNNIGAVGPGPNIDPNDQFGTFTPGSGGGPPPLRLPDGGTSGGGATSTKDSAGCGCEVFGGASRPSGSMLTLLLAAVGLRARRRRTGVIRRTECRAKPRVGSVAGLAIAMLMLSKSSDAAPVPSGAHPRLFMSPAEAAAFATNAGNSGSAAAALVKACQETIDAPANFTTRGGADGDTWPGSALRCAFAYEATRKPEYLTQAIKYWRAALEDDQDLGDRLGCIAGVDTNWASWDGNPPAPPVILTVTHDTGYPMRWYGPYIALTYDWLYNEPGVDASLLSQTRTCLTAWIDYYTARGYHNDEAGANYNAGYVIGKTLAAIAIGNDGGGDGHLWNETTSTLFPSLLIGEGLAGLNGGVGSPAGVLVGGDWAEGWQYGPLSVLEYAVAARALEDNGVLLPEMDAWTDSVGVRLIYGTVPSLDGQWVGGDFDSDSVYQSLAENQFDAVLAGPSSDQAASWAAYEKAQRNVGPGDYFYNALAELRSVPAADYRAQSPAPALWYLARGTRAMYARTSWDISAYWSVFSSAGAVVSDHEHLSASNFVFSRGADHLIVDASNYGEYDSLATNAVTADSTVAQGDYVGTQTPWSEAELVWARGTADATYAARSDFATAFAYSSTPSDIPYAHREWVMLPEGEIVTIDRVHTADAAHQMYVTFHTNTGGGNLTLSSFVASGPVGSSTVAIHAVHLSGGQPKISTPPVGDCQLACSYPCGQCDAARFPIDEYRVAVPGPWATAIHVVDGLAKDETPPGVVSIQDDTIDPVPKQNGGVIGAVVERSSKVSYILASSAVDGASPSAMTYGVPGGSPGVPVHAPARRLPRDLGVQLASTGGSSEGGVVPWS